MYMKGPCYFSQLVRAQWLVNLARRILLYGTLKIIAVLVAKMFRDLSPNFLNFFSKLKFKIFFYFWNCVLIPANDLGVT